MSGTHVIRGASGTITVTAAVLEAVTRRAAEVVADARVRRRGLEIDVQDGAARVSIELSVRYGAVLPEVVRKVQEQVTAELRRICGLDAAAVDVAVEELTSP